MLVVLDSDGDWLSEEITEDDQAFGVTKVDCGLIGRIEVKSREDMGVFAGGGERGAK